MIIYNVMYSVNSVGKFYQGSFSTEELAQSFIESAPSLMHYNLYISVHTLDTETTEGW